MRYGRRVALELEAVGAHPVADNVGDVPGVDVRKALPRSERAHRQPSRQSLTAVAQLAQLAGRVVGNAEDGHGGGEGAKAGGVAVAMVGGVDGRIAEELVRTLTVRTRSS